MMCMSPPMWRRQDGQAILEAALVLPILVLITLGVLVFGIFVNTRLAVSGAAREAARNYAIHKSAPRAADVARDYLRGSLLAGDLTQGCALTTGQIRWDPPPAQCAVEVDDTGGEYVTVRVTYRQQSFVGGLLGMADRVPLSASAVFRIEQ